MKGRKSRLGGGVVEEVLTTPPTRVHRVWSLEHQAFFNRLRTGKGHIVFRARAGTGKTTGIEEGVIVHMPEETIFVTSYARKITQELRRRVVRKGVDVLGLHQVGFRAIGQAWPGIGVAEPKWGREQALTDAVVPGDTPRDIRRLVSDLHTRVRDLCGLDWSLDRIARLPDIEDYEPEEGWTRYSLDWVIRHAHLAADRAAKVAPTKAVGIDFADMMFLPLAWGLLRAEYDAAVVDETQDLTLAQLAMVQRMVKGDGRIVIVGDDRQAIFAFRGADCNALDRLKVELQADELPLTMTYRCCQAVVRLAQQFVPDIHAAPDNPEGVVDGADYIGMLETAQPGDFILSRLNAPLARITLELIRDKRRARMAGREIGTNVKKLLTKLKVRGPEPIEEVLARIKTWADKQIALALGHKDEDRVRGVQDEVSMIQELAREAENGAALSSMCDWLFVKEDDPADSYILCASIHKVKGLEANHVYVLDESLHRRGPSMEEDNLLYVAYTRAKMHLTRVTGVPGLERK